jgi:hypothetical protein
MAIDGKYGRVTLEKGTVGEDEPVVVFRSQDKLLPQVLEYYRGLCAREGSPEHHLASLGVRTEEVRAWQADHFTQVPQSKDLA